MVPDADVTPVILQRVLLRGIVRAATQWLTTGRRGCIAEAHRSLINGSCHQCGQLRVLTD